MQCEKTEDNRRKQEIIADVVAVNQFHIDKRRIKCYKYLCVLSALVSVFSLPILPREHEKVKQYIIILEEKHHVHFYGKQGQYRPQVVRR
jgi:hypothetical protein